MQVYAGSRDVTRQFYNFYDTNTNPGRFPDGTFGGDQGENETDAYLSAVGVVREYFTHELSEEDARGTNDRFAAYAAFIRGGCDEDPDAEGLLVAFYEEVMEFIQSDRSDGFEYIEEADQNAVTGLATDLIIQLWSRGITRPIDEVGSEARTSTEDPNFNPTSELFNANPEVLIHATEVVQQIGSGFFESNCSQNNEQTLDIGRGNPYGNGSPQLNPINQNILPYYNLTTLNLDFRYPRVTEPAQPESAPPESRHIELDLDRH